MASKYILHYGNIAGLSYYYSRALRKIGIDSRHIIPSYDDTGGTDLNKFDRRLPFEEMLYEKSATKFKMRAKRILLCLQATLKCSLVHYYSNSILKTYDLMLFRTAGLPMIISWAGGEARIVSEARKNNPFFYRELDETHDNMIRKRLATFSKYIDFVATDPELAEYSLYYFKKVFILPQPIDLSTCAYSPPEIGSQSPIVLHIPTHRKVKGTSYIEAAVERLKSEGLDFRFQLMAPLLTQKQVRKQIARAEIYVDELRVGSYGMTAVEAMASGTPTITYIREDLVEKYPPNLPLVNANPDTIYTKLRELIINADLRREIGLSSRKFAEEVHSLEVIGPRLKRIYQEIGLTSNE